MSESDLRRMGSTPLDDVLDAADSSEVEVFGFDEPDRARRVPQKN